MKGEKIMRDYEINDIRQKKALLQARQNLEKMQDLISDNTVIFNSINLKELISANKHLSNIVATFKLTLDLALLIHSDGNFNENQF